MCKIFQDLEVSMQTYEIGASPAESLTSHRNSTMFHDTCLLRNLLFCFRMYAKTIPSYAPKFCKWDVLA
jgi:hypothetical protein